MNKNDFIKDLSKRLKYLPKEDREDAIAYYTEYFDEMNPSADEDVTATIGQPKDVAREILSDVKDKHIGKQKEEKNVKNAATVTWLIILGFFSMPFTVPLGIVALVVILVLVIAIFVIVLAFAIAALAVAVAGIISLIAAFAGPSFGQGIMAIGIGLLLLGLGVLMGVGTVYLAKAVLMLFGKIFRR